MKKKFERCIALVMSMAMLSSTVLPSAQVFAAEITPEMAFLEKVIAADSRGDKKETQKALTDAMNEYFANPAVQPENILPNLRTAAVAMGINTKAFDELAASTRIVAQTYSKEEDEQVQAKRMAEHIRQLMGSLRLRTGAQFDSKSCDVAGMIGGLGAIALVAALVTGLPSVVKVSDEQKESDKKLSISLAVGAGVAIAIAAGIILTQDCGSDDSEYY